VTGTPVASYLRFLLFSALLTEGIRQGHNHCLAPNGNSLQALSKLTWFCSIAFKLLNIVPHQSDKVNSFERKNLFCQNVLSFSAVCYKQFLVITNLKSY